MRDFIFGFFRDEDGLETVEMVIILVVVVGMAFAFRRSIMTWYNNMVAEVNAVNTTAPAAGEFGAKK